MARRPREKVQYPLFERVSTTFCAAEKPDVVVERVRSPVPRLTVGHGKKDLVCRPRGSKLLAEKVGSKDVTLRFYAKSAHVIAADVEREEVARDVVAFVARVARR
jgi:esterase/lipase